MAQNISIQTVGDSLREVADLLDRVPSLFVAAVNETQAVTVSSVLRSASTVETIGSVLHIPVAESMAEDGALHTVAEMWIGRVHLNIFHVAPVERELRRPTSVTERIEAAL